MSTIALDLAVAGYPWEEVDEITRGYLVNRAKSEEERAAVPDRTALFIGLGKVIAIGLWLVEQDRGYLLLEGKAAPKREALWIAGGEPARSEPCEAASAHGYLGVETQTVEQITAWMVAPG